MSITENGVKFKEIEAKTYKKVCEYGCELIKDMLEELDAELGAKRDKKKYRSKGKRKKVIKTVMGEVEFFRTVYEVVETEIKSYVYLLDEEIELTESGFFSGLLSEYIVNASCESTYRNAAKTVTELTGQRISHTAAWNIVQQLGEKIDEKETEQAERAKRFEGTGKLESKVLFEEKDGIWLKLQGKSRKEYGSSKEMKLAIAYDGVKKIGKNRYSLTNKVACANFESVSAFKARTEGVIASAYNVDEIEMRLLNGDGAEWIKHGAVEDDVHFQLDPFHRNKAILTYVTDREKQKLLSSLLYESRCEDVLSCIEAYINCSEGQEKVSLEKLYNYFNSNKDGLIEIHRRGLDIPVQEGKEYRHMGCMESNIFTILGNRMKGRRACWSIKGGNNLARMLCLKATNRLSETLNALSQTVLPERYANEERLPMSASKIPLRIGKGYNGYTKGGAFPAIANYEWLRNIGKTAW